MKIKTSSMLLLCIALCTIALDDFFGIGTSMNNTYLFIGSFFLCFILCVVHGQRQMAVISHKYHFIIGYVIAIALSFVVVFFYSLINYPAQDISATINSSYSYLALLLVYPILVLILLRNHSKQIYRLLDIFAIVIYCLILIQVFLYRTNGTLIFMESVVRFRNERLRLGIHFYGNLMIIYNFYKVYCKKENTFFRWTLLTVGLFELVFYQQTRAYTLVILVCIFTIVLLEKNTKIVFIKKIILIALGIAIISQTELVSNFLQSLATTGIEAGSTLGRQYAIGYYWSMFLSNFPFGMGFPNTDKYYFILHNSIGSYVTYVDDVGIIGQLGVWGIFLIPIFVLPVIRWIHILKELKKHGNYDTFVWYCTVLVYIIVSSATLVALDSYRIMIMPIFIALIEFEYRKFKEIERGNDDGGVL
ncbi:hypothetical protein SAMN05421659_11959 [[Clostridium] fimetarium]|uniref:O-antigen ligase n=2 Tax=[Clostridium] fimetarium TaxID=99656 RepID=A0A1I0RN79_9FIRM|nr:hypothetical protein SAMN05421659_11959 [[Clostridium] fimetarium]